MSFHILRNELKAPIRIACSPHMKAQGPIRFYNVQHYHFVVPYASPYPRQN